jgi:hypothetical protein
MEMMDLGGSENGLVCYVRWRYLWKGSDESEAEM